MELLKYPGRVLSILVFLPLLLLAGCSQLTPTTQPGIPTLGDDLIVLGSATATSNALARVNVSNRSADALLAYTVAQDVGAASAGNFADVDNLVSSDVANLVKNNPTMAPDAPLIQTMLLAALDSAQAAVVALESDPTAQLVDQGVADVCIGVEDGSQQYITAQAKLDARNHAKARVVKMLKR